MEKQKTGAYVVVWTSRAKDGTLVDGYVGYRFGPEPEAPEHEAFAKASSMYDKLLEDPTTYAVHIAESVRSTDY
jgi:hypothetical protein